MLYFHNPTREEHVNIVNLSFFIQSFNINLSTVYRSINILMNLSCFYQLHMAHFIAERLKSKHCIKNTQLILVSKRKRKKLLLIDCSLSIDLNMWVVNQTQSVVLNLPVDVLYTIFGRGHISSLIECSINKPQMEEYITTHLMFATCAQYQMYLKVLYSI